MEKKIILVGNGPILCKETLTMNAYAFRTMQFVESLKDLQIEILLLDSKSNYKNKKFPKSKDFKFYENFKEIKKYIQKQKLDFLISVNNQISYECTKIRGDFYRISDLNGTLPYELQAQSKIEGNDLRYKLLLNRQKSILKKSDLITTVSQPQRHSVIGQMGILGLASYQNLGKEMVACIENAQFTSRDQYFHNKDLDLDIPKDSIKILHLGNMNNWCDEETLLKAFAEAKKSCANLIMLLTGNKKSEFGNAKLKNFYKLAEKLGIKNSIYHLGYIDYLDMKSLIESCEVGIVSDLKIYETLFGARNRINEMLKFKLPVITTTGSQISYELAKINQNFGAENKNFKAIAKKLIYLIDKNNKKTITQDIKKFNQTYLDNPDLLDPIKKFIENPFKKKPAKCFIWKFLKRVILKKIKN